MTEERTPYRTERDTTPIATYTGFMLACGCRVHLNEYADTIILTYCEHHSDFQWLNDPAGISHQIFPVARPDKEEQR